MQHRPAKVKDESVLASSRSNTGRIKSQTVNYKKPSIKVEHAASTFVAKNTTAAVRQKSSSPNVKAEPHENIDKGSGAADGKDQCVESRVDGAEDGGVVKCNKTYIKVEKETEETSLCFNLLEGQKALCPPIGDGTRAFYESLYKENNKSIIAIKFCIEHGILIGTQRKEAYRRYCVLKEIGGLKSVGGYKATILKKAEEMLQKLPVTGTGSSRGNRKIK